MLEGLQFPSQGFGSIGGWGQTLQDRTYKPRSHPAQAAPEACGLNLPLDSPRACFTLMGPVEAELSPTPASLTDLTQNSYSFPVLSPGTGNLGERRAAFRDG